MASAESSASLHPELAVAPVKVKKPRKAPAVKRTSTGKRVTAPKSKGSNWLERAQAKSLAAREVKESGAFLALKDKKEHLIRGVAASPYGDDKFIVWIDGRGGDDTFEMKDGLALSAKICKEHKSLLVHLNMLDPLKPNYPKNTIQLVESKLFPDKEDATVAWKSVTKVNFAAVQQAEPEDTEMTEEEGDE